MAIDKFSTPHQPRMSHLVGLSNTVNNVRRTNKISTRERIINCLEKEIKARNFKPPKMTREMIKQIKKERLKKLHQAKYSKKMNIQKGYLQGLNRDPKNSPKNRAQDGRGAHLRSSYIVRGGSGRLSARAKHNEQSKTGNSFKRTFNGKSRRFQTEQNELGSERGADLRLSQFFTNKSQDGSMVVSARNRSTGTGLAGDFEGMSLALNTERSVELENDKMLLVNGVIAPSEKRDMEKVCEVMRDMRKVLERNNERVTQFNIKKRNRDKFDYMRRQARGAAMRMAPSAGNKK